MADAARSFKINIVSEFDAKGLKHEQEEMIGLKRRLDELGVSHRDLRFLLMQMGPEYAHMGHEALIGFTNPATLGLLALTAGIGALIQQTEKSDEAFRQSAEVARQSFGDIKKVINETADAVAKVREKHADWAKSVAEDSGKIRREMDADIAKLHAVAAAQREVADARAEAEGALGKPDKVAADKRKRETEARIAQQEGQDEEARIRKAMAQVNAELANAELQEEAASQALMSGTPQLSAAKKAEQAKAAEEQAKEARKKANAAGDEVAAKAAPTFGQNLLDQALDLLSLNGMFGMMRPAGTARRDDALRDAEAKEKAALKEAEDAEAFAKKSADAARARKAEEDKLQKSSEELEGKIKRLKGELRELGAQAEKVRFNTQIKAEATAQANHFRDLAEKAKEETEAVKKTTSQLSHFKDQNLRAWAETHSVLGEHSQALSDVTRDIGALKRQVRNTFND